VKKKLLSIVSVIILVFLCVSCGKKDFGEAPFGIYEIDFSEEPVTITYLIIGNKPTNGQTEAVIEKLNKKLRKKINAQLDVYYISWDDYLTNYNYTLDAGEAGIDLVGTGTDWLDTWPNVMKGNFYPLTEEMLRKYCPGTYSDVTPNQWNKCSYEGNIYFIPENNYSQWTNHGFIYRGDIADKAGIGNIESWQELTDYMEYVADYYPEMIPWDADGKNTIITLGYLMSASSYAPIYELGTYGLWGAYQSDMRKIISPYYEGDELVEFAKLMKKWDSIGVWRKDFSLSENNEDEFYAGITAATQHHTQNYYTEIKPLMEIEQPDSDVRFYWFGTESANLMKTSIMHGAMAVYAGSKNPERALMAYDLLRNDEECYRLIRYGIEGSQYIVNKEGMLERPSGYNYDRDNIVLNFWWGRRDEMEVPDSEFSWADYYKLVDGYANVAIDYPWDGIPFMTADTEEEIKPILEVCDKFIPEITYAKYSCTPEEEVELFRNALKEAGFEKVTFKLQKILNLY
jgi:maltose-binding protein MalE